MPQVKRTTLWGALLIVLSGALLTTAVALALGGTISTVAGDGTEGFGGDGGSATSAQLAGPTGVAVDSSGNLFIADRVNHRIRKVDGLGNITTLAGSGKVGGLGAFSGDGGPATSAELNAPFGVAVDSSGNVFFSGHYSHRIRKVDVSGNISTVAGDGTGGFGGDGGPATNAQLAFPEGIAVDSSGNLYIADSQNQRIRKVDTAGNISTVAGTGATGLGAGGFSGDGGLATSAQLNRPRGVAVDSSGNLFIADQLNHRIRKVNTSGNIRTVAGDGTPGFSGDGGPATSAQLDSPAGITVDAFGNLFISDTTNNLIRRVDPSGNISTVAGAGTAGFSGDGGPATSAQLSAPIGVAIDSSHNLFIADLTNQRVRQVDPVADLAITNTDSPDPAATLTNLTYTVTVTNNGPATSTNTVLTDTLPAGAVLVSATAGCTDVGGTVTCNLGNLAKGATSTVTIVVTHEFAGTITNTASVTSDTARSTATTNTVVQETFVIPFLSPWGLIVLGSLLAVVFMWRLRRGERRIRA